MGLGGPHGVLPEAPESMLANPAAMSMIGSFALEAAYHQGVEDVTYNGIVAATPVLSWLSVGAGAASLTAGTIETYDYTGNRYEADLEEDRMGMAGVAVHSRVFSFGADVKYLESVLVGTDKGSMITGDAGMGLKVGLGGDRPAWMGESPDWMLLGFSVCNLGASIDYGGLSDPPPLMYRMGVTAARDFGGTSGRRVLVALSLDVPRSTARPEGRGGIELRWPFGFLVLETRAGAVFRHDSGAYSAGAGIAIRGICVDYAYLMSGAPFGATHHFSLSLFSAGFLGSPKED
jgi:hypothetical protein